MDTLAKKLLQFGRDHRVVDFLLIVVGLAIFVTITFLNIDRASIWFDEAFSAYITQFNFGEIAAYTATDVHPPLYYWLLKIWEMLFGTSEVALRSMSVFFGGVAIVAGYLLSRRLFGRLVGAVSLLFMVLSPMIIRYSDEARMYTLAAAIVLIASYILVYATSQKRRWPWIVYGVFVALGMLTHYFTALAWIAHWLWRATQTYRAKMRAKEFFQKFFAKEWIVAHITAGVLFIGWLPFMVIQLTTIQRSGFWIGPVTADTLTNYASSVLYYLSHGDVQGWAAFLLVVVIILVSVLAFRAYKQFRKSDRKNYLLIAFVTIVPVVLLFLASLPPLRPSFVERYLIPAVFALSIFMAMVVVVGTRRWRRIFRVIPIVLISGMMIFGTANVFFYGNYNRNSNEHVVVKELIQEIDKVAQPGQPYIANTPWVFYEAVFYDSPEHPVYFIDEDTEYLYGSLDMLKYNEQHKITDLDTFLAEHPTVWYLGYSPEAIEAPRDGWVKLQDVSFTSWVNGTTHYRAAEFEIN